MKDTKPTAETKREKITTIYLVVLILIAGPLATLENPLWFLLALCTAPVFQWWMNRRVEV